VMSGVPFTGKGRKAPDGGAGVRDTPAPHLTRENYRTLVRNPIRIVSFNVTGQNVLGLIRSAEAFLAEQVTFTASPGGKAYACGTDKWQPWGIGDPYEAIRDARLCGYSIVAIEQALTSRPLTDGLPQSVCLVLGNERTGIPVDALGMCDEIAEIPMHGFAQCLNIVVAGSIALYEWGRVWLRA